MAAGGEEESEQEQHEDASSGEERDKIRLEVTLEVRKGGRSRPPRVDRLIHHVGREGDKGESTRELPY